MVRETTLSPDQLIAPLFVVEGKNKIIPIDSMPGQARLSIDELIQEVKVLYSLGIKTVALFPFKTLFQANFGHSTLF